MISDLQTNLRTLKIIMRNWTGRWCDEWAPTWTMLMLWSSRWNVKDLWKITWLRWWWCCATLYIFYRNHNSQIVHKTNRKPLFASLPLDLTKVNSRRADWAEVAKRDGIINLDILNWLNDLQENVTNFMVIRIKFTLFKTMEMILPLSF